MINGLTGHYGDLVESDPSAMERLLDIRGRAPVHFLYKYILDACGRTVVGFKFKFDEMMLEEYASVVDAIRRDTDIKVIVLWRENLLARHLSHVVVGKVTGITMLKSSDEDLDVPPIRVDVEDLLADVQRQRERLAHFEHLFSGPPNAQLSYEEFLSSPQTESKRLTDFLGVGEYAMRPGTKKNIRRPLSEAIANFEEVCAALRGTDLERFCEMERAVEDPTEPALSLRQRQEVQEVPRLTRSRPSSPRGPGPSADDYVQRGREMQAAGRLEEAEALYQAALGIAPTHAEAWFALGGLAEQAWDLEVAEQCYSRLVQYHPRHARGHLALGNVQVRTFALGTGARVVPARRQAGSETARTLAQSRYLGKEPRPVFPGP